MPALCHLKTFFSIIKHIFSELLINVYYIFSVLYQIFKNISNGFAPLFNFLVKDFY
jgi:hypothetical protein